MLVALVIIHAGREMRSSIIRHTSAFGQASYKNSKFD